MAYWNEDAVSEVALIDPEGFGGALRRRRPARKLMPALGVGYLAACLERNGEKVRVLDAAVSTFREVQRFLSQPANLYGVTAVGATFRAAVAAARAVKQRYPSVPVLLGGPLVAIDPAASLTDPAIDYALRGEAEEVIIDLVEVFKRRSDPPAEVLSKVPGLVYRAGGAVRINPPVPRLRRLDDLPFPAWHLFPMARYRQHVLLTSRGCPRDCGFCTVESVWGRQWIRRDPEAVASEAAWVQEHWGRKLIHVVDDNLTLDARHVFSLCEAFVRRQLRLNWAAEGVQAEALTPELAAQLRAAGCHSVALGIESADPAVLQAAGKPVSGEILARAVRTAQTAGLQVVGRFMVGNPGDTEAAVLSSLAFVQETRLDLPVFVHALPYPNTKLREYAVARGRLLEPDFTRFDPHGREPAFETPEFPAAARRRVFARARQFCRRRRWRYHLTFWWPPRLLRRNGFEIASEVRLWFAALGWPWRYLRQRVRRGRSEEARP